MIGIRLADGSYYPVMDETRKTRKRMVLGPANDNQQAVHIQFFRDDSDAFISPEYLGSVNLEHLSPGSKDEKNIAIFISVNDQDQLEVSARDEDGGDERQLILQTRAEAMTDENLFAGDDFSLDDDVSLPDPGDFIGDKEDMEALHQEASLHGGSLGESEAPEWELSPDDQFSEPQRRGLKPGIVAALVLVACSVTVGASFLIFQLMRGSEIPPIDSMLPAVEDGMRIAVSRASGIVL